MAERVTQSETSQVVIEVWSDLGCPWCYVGRHRLPVAIAQRPDADRRDIRMRSFEHRRGRRRSRRPSSGPTAVPSPTSSRPGAGSRRSHAGPGLWTVSAPTPSTCTAWRSTRAMRPMCPPLRSDERHRHLSLPTR
ncbi:DsbA family protein [Streptosporangium algeriense]|uniref:DsbA family protein n=1 Tax=Streptosporangium algeriense TaxID=1682748 RepID=A0ABW3DYD2_9ACTN